MTLGFITVAFSQHMKKNELPHFIKKETPQGMPEIFEGYLSLPSPPHVNRG
jgi:hypothetical protein